MLAESIDGALVVISDDLVGWVGLGVTVVGALVGFIALLRTARAAEASKVAVGRVGQLMNTADALAAVPQLRVATDELDIAAHSGDVARILVAMTDWRTKAREVTALLDDDPLDGEVEKAMDMAVAARSRTEKGAIVTSSTSEFRAQALAVYGAASKAVGEARREIANVATSEPTTRVSKFRRTT